MKSVKKSIALSVTLTLLAASVPQAALAGAVARGKLISDAGTDPFWNNVVLLAGNDSNITGQTSIVDQSRYLQTIATNGNASTTSATAPTGLSSSVAFDGSGDRLTSNNSVNSFPGQWTIEAYVRLSDTTGSKTIVAIGDNGTSGRFQLAVSGSTLYLDKYGTGTLTSGGTLSVNTWHHIALTRDGSNSIQLWLDGIAVGTPATDATNVGNNSTIHIGTLSDNTNPMNGYMAAVRVTKGVARYTSNFTPPVLPLKLGTYEPIVATGGTVTTVGNYRVHTFTSSGTFKVLKGTGHIWYLVVGGGGGGGAYWSGGGGGGGYRENSAYSYPVTVGSYAVTVGAGGAGYTATGEGQGTAGESSTFSTITATGGAPGIGDSTGCSAGVAGSSGSGAGGSGVCSGGAGTAGQGNNGGASASQAGGGGGGAGAVGGNASANVGGNGGAGTASSITGVSVIRAGGGGASANTTPGTGAGGGGNGAIDSAAGTAGAANTGSGGGGGSSVAGKRGENGGSGIVIIRYPIGKPQTKLETKDSPIVATGGTITTVTVRGITRKVHTFTTTGSADPFVVTSGKGKVWYLVIGGGGGGGDNHGGGGGAGGYRENRAYTYPVSVGSYTVTVGAGGAGGPAGNPADPGTAGGNSVFDTITATGGGYGGSRENTPNGGSGGSGGGGGGQDGCAPCSGGSGTAGQGNNGGTSVGGAGNARGGGGGGAGSVGAIGVAGSGVGAGAAGGNGLASSITGTSVTRAGGGGALQGGTGGTGGGGEGGNGACGGLGCNGTANTGSGGGGGGGGYGGGGNGGSGIVVISYITTRESVAKSPPALGLVGWWPFDKGFVSDKIYDRSNKGNNGYFYNGATSTANVAGKLGKAMSFDGVNDYINIGTASSLNFTSQSFSVGGWFKFSDLGPETLLFGNGQPSASGYYVWWDTTTDKLTFTTHQSGARQDTSSTASPITTGQWYHITAVRNGSSGKIYVNGVDITGTPASHINPASATNPFTIGILPSDLITDPLNGFADDVRIYNRALSAAEVAQLYQSR